jgi:hypothetical protein
MLPLIHMNICQQRSGATHPQIRPVYVLENPVNVLFAAKLKYS